MKRQASRQSDAYQGINGGKYRDGRHRGEFVGVSMEMGVGLRLLTQKMAYIFLLLIKARIAT